MTAEAKLKPFGFLIFLLDLRPVWGQLRGGKRVLNVID